MKRVLFTTAAAMVVLTAARPSFARTIRVAVTRQGNVPVPCAEERLGSCHNRWHPAIRPAATADPGDTVIFETRDAFDNPFNRRSTPPDVAAANLNLVHPLTGPLFVRGAQRGDVLAVTILDAVPGPDRFGYTVIVPGFGFLRDVFPHPDIVHWEFEQDDEDGSQFATSADLPGVRIPLHGFTGTIGVALGLPEIETAFQREDQLLRAGGFVLPPQPQDAVPNDLCGPRGAARTRCLRTIPPRENGGNTDIKQMVKGTTLLFPCFIDGCGLSMGDVHFAQGDGEVSGTAIEMNGIVTVKVEVRRGQAALLRFPQFESRERGILKDLEPDRFIATIGIPVKSRGEVIIEETWIDGVRLGPLTNQSEDVTLAARDALLKMIDLLTGPQSPSRTRLSRNQAYILCSVACDLKISNLVDVPNFVVSDFLHLDIFEQR